MTPRHPVPAILITILSCLLLLSCHSGTGVTGSKRSTTASPHVTNHVVTAADRPANAATSDDPALQRAGVVRPAPRDIRNFSPRESKNTLPAAASSIDLRQVFDELGPDTTLWHQHVQTLANPFFEGRAPGTRGGLLAAEYMEFYFRQYGLRPAFPSETSQSGGESSQTFSSYVQTFDFPSPNPEANVMTASLQINGESLAIDKDFAVLGVSGNGQVSGPITFVGYGIAAGVDGYTSFDENSDLSGRIAMLLRYEPLDDTGKSRWSTARFSVYSGMAAKLRAVADRGAAAIILVNPPGAVDGKQGLDSLAESARFGRRLKIPAIQITQEAADRILAAADADRRDLLALRRLADAAEITTIDFASATVASVATELMVNDRIAAQNVAAVLPGRGRLADEWVVIGGHYDHVGYGYTGANPANIGQLHPGADDNASGTASILIAAKRLSSRYAEAGADADLRSIMFIGFDAEEAGLHGSKHFVEHPPISTGAINVMFNMDMVGRLRNDNLLVQGTGTAERFEEILKPVFERSGLRIAASPTGLGPSDHSSFYGKKVPVLFLFTGEHPDYHKPADMAHTVNAVGAMKVVKLLEELTLQFATSPERLQFASAAGAARPRQTGARVTLGTMPDYTAELETGVRVEDVRDGSSAAEAGIKAGDIMLTWNGEELTGAAKLAEFLGKHEPGDRVTIVLRRGDAELTFNVHLKSRAAQ